MANKAVTAKSKSAPVTLATKAPWPLVRFGDVVRDVKATVDRDTTELTRFVAGEHMGSDDVHLRRWGDLNGDYLGPAFHRGFCKGQVLYGSRRTYLKKVAVAPFDGICANTTFVLESKDTETLLPELLPFIMLTDAFTQHSVRESKGSVNPYINWKDIAKYQFPLPPKNEQRRIADILWAADEAMEAHRRIECDFHTVRARAIDTLVKRMCNANENLKSLNDISKITDCKHRTPTLLDKGLPMVAPGDISWGPLCLDKCKQISMADREQLMDHVRVQPGDLVFSRNQTFGVAAYVQPGQVFAVGQDTVLIQAASVDTKTIYVLLRSSFVQKQIQQFAMGSTFKRINLSQIRSLKVPNVETQDAEVARDLFNRLEHSCQCLAEKSKALGSLQWTVRQQVFRCDV